MTKRTNHTTPGQPIDLFGNKQRPWQTPASGVEGWSDRIVAHAERYIGPAGSICHDVVSDLLHVGVYHIKPSPSRNCHTLFTAGLSSQPMAMPNGAEEYGYAELMICLPPKWPGSDKGFKHPEFDWPVQWLKQLARFPHETQSWLGYGRMMPNGEPPKPLSDKTKLNGIVLLPPAKVNPGFLELRIDEKRMVRFYCLVPLYQEEMDYKRKYGTDALMTKLQTNGIHEVVDLNRKNTCKSSILSIFGRK